MMSPATQTRNAAEVPLWEARLLGLLHPAVVEIVEACLWIDEPLSASLLVRVFDGSYPLNKLAYHVRRLAEAGVLELVSTTPRRGAIEHFLRLVD
jgi:hypothetical protein